MIVKEAENRHQQVEILQGLLAHPEADAGTRKRIEREILNIRAGIRGEEEATYEMKVLFNSAKNWMVIHDLRIEHDGLGSSGFARASTFPRDLPSMSMASARHFGAISLMACRRL